MNVISVVAYLLIILALVSSIFVVFRLRREPLAYVFILIVMLYVLIGPYLNSFSKTSAEMNIYYLYQSLVLLLFYIPFCWFMVLAVNARTKSYGGQPVYKAVKLSVVLPCILLLLLCYFWMTVLDYNLLFRRLGHNGLYEASAAVPKLQLYIYRMTVESSFFVVLVLKSTMVFCDDKTKYIKFYRLVNALYIVSFIVYFGINSRMQLLIFFLMFGISYIVLTGSKTEKKGGHIILWVPLLLITATLLRELFFEDNARLEINGMLSTLGNVIFMIAARVDILTIFYELEASGYSPLSVNLNGYMQSIYFMFSFFFDPEYYDSVKQSLQTSSSVITVIDITGSAATIDFPKSFVVDTILTFGCLGLLFLAGVYSSVIKYVIAEMTIARAFKFSWFFAAFMIPILLQFEKELLGTFFAIIKWSPVLLLVLFYKPKFRV